VCVDPVDSASCLEDGPVASWRPSCPSSVCMLMADTNWSRRINCTFPRTTEGLKLHLYIYICIYMYIIRMIIVRTVSILVDGWMHG